MKEKDWKELERTEDAEREQVLLKATCDEDEHPVWYDGPCNCRLCWSYGDC